MREASDKPPLLLKSRYFAQNNAQHSNNKAASRFPSNTYGKHATARVGRGVNHHQSLFPVFSIPSKVAASNNVTNSKTPKNRREHGSLPPVVSAENKESRAQKVSENHSKKNLKYSPADDYDSDFFSM